MIQPITSVQFNKPYNRNFSFKSQYIPHEVHITPELKTSLERTLGDKALTEVPISLQNKLKASFNNIKENFKEFFDTTFEDGTILKNSEGDVIGCFLYDGSVFSFEGKISSDEILEQLGGDTSFLESIQIPIEDFGVNLPVGDRLVEDLIDTVSDIM